MTDRVARLGGFTGAVLTCGGVSKFEGWEVLFGEGYTIALEEAQDLHIYPDAGHAPHFQYPELFLKHAELFFDSWS